MANSNSIELEGVVREALPNTMFRVAVNIAPKKEAVSDKEPLPEKEVLILATISGKMRTHYIRILPGDRVKVVVVPPDLSKGRITYRYR